MSASYEQRSIGGGAAIHTVRAWKAGELGGGTGRQDKGPSMAARASLRRLNTIQAKVAAGVAAAGSVGAYYDSGGLAGPFGRSLGKAEPRRKAAPKLAPVVPITPSACPHCGQGLTPEGVAS